MKFSLALTFAAGAMAAQVGSPVKRQAAVIQSAIAAVQAGTESLTTAVNGFSGVGQVASLQAAAADLLSTIQSQTSTVSGSADLTLTEAAPLAQTVGGLASAVEAATSAAKSKKATFVSVGVGSVVYDQLVQLRSAANSFAQAITSKVPSSLQDLAASLSAPIIANLDSAVQEFADQQGGSTPSSSSAPSSTAAPSSSSAAPSSSGAASSTAAPTTTLPGPPATSTSKGPVQTYTGAAVANAAGFGAVAMAAVAAVAAL